MCRKSKAVESSALYGAYPKAQGSSRNGEERLLEPEDVNKTEEGMLSRDKKEVPHMNGHW